MQSQHDGHRPQEPFELKRGDVDVDGGNIVVALTSTTALVIPAQELITWAVAHGYLQDYRVHPQDSPIA